MRRGFLAPCLAAASIACGTPPSPASPGGDPDRVVGPGCEGLPGLEPGATIEGTTLGMASAMTSRCGGGALGPESVHTFSLDRSARVRFELETKVHDGALHLREGCGDEGRELACNDDAGSTGRSLIWSHLEPGAYRLVVDGSGRTDTGPFSLTFDVAPEGAEPSLHSRCQAASPLGKAGGSDIVFTTSTFFAASDIETPCSSSPGGPDVFHSLVLAQESLVTVDVVASDHSFPVIAVAGGCDGPWDSCSTTGIVARLGPGKQIIAVDSLGADLLGGVTVSVSVRPVADLEAACGAARALVPGEILEGETSGEDLFRAGCGGGAAGPESVHSFRIEERSRVVVRLNSAGRDGVLHIRSDCTAPHTEVACNDDHGQKHTSEVDIVLEAGTYAVFADGHGPADAGAYTLEARISPP